MEKFRTKVLYLVDGSNLAYRAFYSKRDLSTKKGVPTNAIFIYLKMLNKILNTFDPLYIATIFDSKVPTFRNRLYPDYKGHRPDMPDGLKIQFPYLKEVTESFGVRYINLDGYEADDIIGTLIEKFGRYFDKTVVISGDKDLMQLVSSSTVMLDTMKDIEYDIEGVKKKFGVPPERMTDLLGLMGDTSDNIPGVTGIGEKRARDLISRFGSLEGLYENLHLVEKESIKNALIVHREDAFLSKELATIKRDVPLDISLKDLNRKERDNNSLLRLLREFEFKSLEEEIFGITGIELKKDYRLILSRDDFNELLDLLKKTDEFSIDIETTSKDPLRAEPVGISICFDRETAFYIPFGHIYDGVPRQLKKEEILRGLQPFLSSEDKVKIGQNFKFDYIILKKEGIEPKGIIFDTMIASYLLNPERRNHNLDDLALNELNYKKISYKDVMEGKAKGSHFGEVEIEKAMNYSAEDAHITYLLRLLFDKKLKDEGLYDLFRDVEMPLSTVLAEMEYRGVLVDKNILHEMSINFQQRIDQLLEKIYDLAGMEFNVQSPKQLGYLLFEKLNLPRLKKTKTGYSTNQEVLEYLANLHPVCTEILNFRSLSKLKSTYIDTLPALINPITGRVHTSYNQTITRTGRLSSSEPNLQNIPVKTEEGRKIRKAFIAPEGYQLLSADYSQIELRLLAHISDDEKLKRTFIVGGDIHTSTASDLFGVKEDEVSFEMRRKAKTINFGIIYGISSYGLAKELKISKRDAKDYIDEYFRKFPGVKRYWDKVLKDARENGMVKTIFGRKRKIPNLVSNNDTLRSEAEREAINTPIQGSAADIIKMAMIELYKRIKEEKLDSYIIMQVHDELVLEVSNRDIDRTEDLVRDVMENIVHLSIPLKVSISRGKNWSECY